MKVAPLPQVYRAEWLSGTVRLFFESNQLDMESFFTLRPARPIECAH